MFWERLLAGLFQLFCHAPQNPSHVQVWQVSRFVFAQISMKVFLLGS